MVCVHNFIHIVHILSIPSKIIIKWQMCPKLPYILLWPKLNGCTIFPFMVITQFNPSNVGGNLCGFPFFIVNDGSINFRIHKSLSDPLLHFERFGIIKLLGEKINFFNISGNIAITLSLNVLPILYAINYVIKVPLYLHQYLTLSSHLYLLIL